MKSEAPPRVAVFGDLDALTDAATRHVVALASRAIAERGRFTWALAGGSTPRPLYQRLASTRVDWSRVHFFWGDERCVPPDAAESNYRMAREALLDAIAPPATNVHRMRGEEPPEQAASSYEQMLHQFFETASGSRPPSFDLVLLGMGSDGHTASLFPGTRAVSQEQRWVVANCARESSSCRLTLTPVIINAAAHVVFFVSGASKAEPLKRVLQPAPQGTELPAQRIQPTAGDLLWMVDAAAAAHLGTTP